MSPKLVIDTDDVQRPGDEPIRPDLELLSPVRRSASTSANMAGNTRTMRAAGEFTAVGPSISSPPIQSSLACADRRLRRFTSISLIADQAVGDVVFVDVADVRDRLETDPLRGGAFNIVEPQIGIEASLLRFTTELSQTSGPGVVGGKYHQHLVQIVPGLVLEVLVHHGAPLHYTPTYSSWLNQVELWFSKIERDVTARGIFTSVTDLRRKLMRYIKHYNKTATPIRWAYADPSRRIA